MPAFLTIPPAYRHVFRAYNHACDVEARAMVAWNNAGCPKGTALHRRIRVLTTAADTLHGRAARKARAHWG